MAAEWSKRCSLKRTSLGENVKLLATDAVDGNNSRRYLYLTNQEFRSRIERERARNEEYATPEFKSDAEKLSRSAEWSHDNRILLDRTKT
ncbi:hypothetical protein EVAR_34564_1 [Eumeta japonica]|uniref:Uncharacterized protein n=1 Tax=Eumeta variegata TaxID=151549 RepID=A0A4C1X4B9_EUMVA|nr:hypothetical protein EVAR_34564_1 [Eumeta japonica]